MAQNITYGPRGRTLSFWLYWMTTLLFGFLWLFFFVSVFSHFSDITYSLANVSPQTKGRWRIWGQASHPRGLLCLSSSFLLFIAYRFSSQLSVLVYFYPVSPVSVDHWRSSSKCFASIAYQNLLQLTAFVVYFLH